MDTQNIVLLKRHSWDNSFNSFEVENRGRCSSDFKHECYLQLQTIRVFIKLIYDDTILMICNFVHMLTCKVICVILEQNNPSKATSKFIFVIANSATHFQMMYKFLVKCCFLLNYFDHFNCRTLQIKFIIRNLNLFSKTKCFYEGCWCYFKAIQESLGYISTW